jgi:ubiquitin carboxyl-terminal hydrolase 10
VESSARPQADSVTIEDWRLLRLEIQVRFPSSHFAHTYIIVTDFQKHDSVHAIEDALARISHLQPVRLGLPGVSDATQQVLTEALPPVLVLHLKRFLYDVAVDSIIKISKSVQFAPELKIPLRMIFSIVSIMRAS